MEKIKYIIILLIILLIVLVTIILLQNKTPNQQENLEPYEQGPIPEENIIPLEEEKTMSAIVQVSGFIESFWEHVQEKNQNINNTEEVYNVLSDTYKTKNNITKENVLEFFNQYKDMTSYTITKIYTESYLHSEQTVNIFYYVEGKIRKGTEAEEVYIILKEDLQNYTYSIELVNKEDFIEAMQPNSIIETNIPITENNKIPITTISNYDICLEYMNHYFDILQNNVEEAYGLLDESYRNKRFGSVENFKKYINDNPDYVTRRGFAKYGATNNKDGYKQYVCENSYGYTYIFTEKSAMQYTVQLDNYTIETEDFIQKYNEEKDDKKAQIDVQKFIYMINNKDYANAYQKLDETFKQTYFKTQEDFENKIKQIMFNYNSIAIDDTERINDTYVINVRLKDLSNASSSQEKECTMVVKLLQGTDFIISFSN